MEEYRNAISYVVGKVARGPVIRTSGTKSTKFIFNTYSLVNIELRDV